MRRLLKGFIIALLFVVIVLVLINFVFQDFFNPYLEPGPYRQGEKNQWKLVLDEEFNEDSLNTTLWSYNFPSAPITCEGHCHNHQGWMTSENVIISDGLLRIKGENYKHPDAPDEHFWGKKSFPLDYTTGAITTFGKFNFTYGYLEARQKLPKGPTGFWPAFWTIQSGPRNTYSEIDIMEWLSGNDMSYYTNLQTKAPYKGLISSSFKHNLKANLTEDFHIYGVEWLPNRISFYFDRKEIYRITNPGQLDNINPQHIRINLGIGGWVSSPDNRTIWPAWYDTDWVRLWQYSENHSQL